MYSPQMQVQQCTTLPQPVRPRFTPPASTLSPSFSRDLKSIKIAQFDSSKVLENGRWYFFGDVFPWRDGKYNRNWRNFAAIGFSTLRAFCHMYDFLSQTCICCIFNQSQGQFIFVYELIPSLLVVILKERAATVAELDTAIFTDLDKEISSNV